MLLGLWCESVRNLLRVKPAYPRWPLRVLTSRTRCWLMWNSEVLYIGPGKCFSRHCWLSKTQFQHTSTAHFLHSCLQLVWRKLYRQCCRSDLFCALAMLVPWLQKFSCTTSQRDYIGMLKLSTRIMHPERRWSKIAKKPSCVSCYAEKCWKRLYCMLDYAATDTGCEYCSYDSSRRLVHS